MRGAVGAAVRIIGRRARHGADVRHRDDDVSFLEEVEYRAASFSLRSLVQFAMRISTPAASSTT